MRRGKSPLRMLPRPKVLRPMPRRSLKKLLMMPRVKTPPIARLTSPQVRPKRRALRSQEKKRLLRVQVGPLKMLRVKLPVTIRQEKQLMPQARTAVRRRAKAMLPLPKTLRQIKQPTPLQMMLPPSQPQKVLLGQTMLEPVRAPVLASPPLQVRSLLRERPLLQMLQVPKVLPRQALRVARVVRVVQTRLKARPRDLQTAEVRRARAQAKRTVVIQREIQESPSARHFGHQT